MAVKLTPELKDFVARPDVVKVLATINEDGSPNIGPKMSTHVYDDGSLAYAEATGKRHYRNVQQDQRIAIACIDWQGREGYRFVGRAELHQDGEVFQRVAERVGPRIQVKLAVRLVVDEVYSLSFRSAGEKLL